MEGFVHIRIDDRLIHGQVATRWVAQYKVNRIMVIDDEVANNDTEKAILRSATPQGVNTSLLNYDKACANIKANNYAGQRVMLIVKSPLTLVKLFNDGLKLLPINIGNMSNRTGTTSYKKSVNMTAEEREAIDYLLSKEIAITARMVPDEEEKSIVNFF
jgi:PTS system mannose-specific IIB component